MKGQFVISLDFEKYWGVFDSIASKSDYSENLKNVDLVIDRLIELSNSYNIKITFSTVGFLFNKNKAEYIKNTPTSLPNYILKKHNPYPFINDLKDNEELNDQRFGHQSVLKIRDSKQHEVGTHTYCHYYCLEDGQTVEQFDADIKMAKKVASNLDIKVQSIVFPRNQVNAAYLKSCYDNGITSYRGTEDHSIYQSNSKENATKPLQRAMRLLDSYINITGNHTHKFSGVEVFVL